MLFKAWNAVLFYHPFEGGGFFVLLQKRRRMTQTPSFRLLVISRPDKSGHPLQRGMKKKRDARVRHDAAI